MKTVGSPLYRYWRWLSDCARVLPLVARELPDWGVRLLSRISREAAAQRAVLQAVSAEDPAEAERMIRALTEIGSGAAAGAAYRNRPAVARARLAHAAETAATEAERVARLLGDDLTRYVWEEESHLAVLVEDMARRRPPGTATRPRRPAPRRTPG